MATEIYVPLLSALAGAVIGTIGTVTAVIVQARKDDRRNRRELAVKLATEQQSRHIELASKQGGGVVPPVDLYLIHAFSLLDAIESGSLSAEKLKSINDKLHTLYDSLEKDSVTRTRAETRSKDS